MLRRREDHPGVTLLADHHEPQTFPDRLDLADDVFADCGETDNQRSISRMARSG
jgi:hypothetical protein